MLTLLAMTYLQSLPHDNFYAPREGEVIIEEAKPLQASPSQMTQASSTQGSTKVVRQLIQDSLLDFINLAIG